FQAIVKMRLLKCTKHFYRLFSSTLRNYTNSHKETKVIYFDNKNIHYSRNLDNGKHLDEEDKSVIPSKILQGKGISFDEWEEIVTELKYDSKNINDLNIHTVIMKKCRWAKNYHLATSYINFLKSKGQEMNLATHGYYLLICGLNTDVCGEDRVLEVYQQLTRRVKVRN
ncbi:unnamed protein product, partial [Meganyctiphanes norvegica]